MKKLILLLHLVLPLLVSAQNGCDFFDFRKMEIDKTDLNSAQSDFGPAFVEDELWFSAFTAEEIKRLAKGDNKDIFYNLYNVKTDAEGNVNGNKNVQFEAISAGFHAGPVSYCEKTKELFVTLSNFDNPEIKNNVYQKADIRLKIIITKKINGIWTVTEEFPHNNPAYSVGHPAISITGDTLFYASDKPGSGFGESDIYMSVRENGKWGKPVNMGEKVNSAFDEMFPFFFDGSVLFYASNMGKNKKEDFNLKYICKTGNSFSDSKTLDIFNTKKDDFGLVIHPKGKVGYFVSRRNGGLGDDDIYKVTFKGEHKLELVVMDRKTIKPIHKPKVKFSDNVNADVSGKLVTRLLPENSTLVVTSEIEGYQNSSINITTVNKPYGTIQDTIWVEKVEVGQKFVLENIFYDFDKWDILPESEVELNKLISVLNDNPSWKVELGSHTDARGSDSYNEILSQKRSESAVSYIINKGISNDRIIAKGYGESQLINHCKNGVECPDEVHRQNRRTEFKILEMDGK
ncbi:MAG: OmpA family protein [Bacteroidetes bacterium]|nr:MAG: OmpA family protein [Bacteroidota bacterium]